MNLNQQITKRSFVLDSMGTFLAVTVLSGFVLFATYMLFLSFCAVAGIVAGLAGMKDIELSGAMIALLGFLAFSIVSMGTFLLIRTRLTRSP